MLAIRKSRLTDIDYIFSKMREMDVKSVLTLHKSVDTAKDLTKKFLILYDHLNAMYTGLVDDKIVGVGGLDKSAQKEKGYSVLWLLIPYDVRHKPVFFIRQCRKMVKRLLSENEEVRRFRVYVPQDDVVAKKIVLALGLHRTKKTFRGKNGMLVIIYEMEV